MIDQTDFVHDVVSLCMGAEYTQVVDPLLFFWYAVGTTELSSIIMPTDAVILTCDNQTWVGTQEAGYYEYANNQQANSGFEGASQAQPGDELKHGSDATGSGAG